VRWLVQRIAAGGTRQGLMEERSTQRFDFAAVLSTDRSAEALQPARARFCCATVGSMGVDSRRA
jgi:hypothetical protein